MSAEANSLPIIDIQSLYDGDEQARIEADRAIGAAAENFGAFLLTGLPASLQPKTSGIEKLFTLFDLPQSVLYEMGKREMRPTSTRCMRGYVDRRSGGFAYNEIFDIGPEQPAPGPDIDGIELVTETNVWPSTEPAPNWRQNMVARFVQTEALGIKIISALARYLGVNETAAAARYQNSSSSMRLLKYPGHTTAANAAADSSESCMHNGQERSLIGKQHTDNGGLTMQWQDQPGLQIKTPAGEWLDVPARAQALSVHLGEALETQSCRKFAATPHRILGRCTVRHSIVFFLEPGLFSSIRPFSQGTVDASPKNEDSYAASMINTLRKTGRA